MVKKIIVAGILCFYCWPTTVGAEGEYTELENVSPVVQITAEEAEALMN